MFTGDRIGGDKKNLQIIPTIADGPVIFRCYMCKYNNASHGSSAK